ncbi:alpha/beta fold hydrolase [Terribacillus saccharophilus]|uniref:alpha/beta hydrolase n=1 Tax=Terribacillus saccharophilus TaxID=361277 RepID=UPI0039823AC8
MKKRYKVLLTMLLVILVLAGVFLFENSYGMQEKHVTIKTEQGELSGFAAMPEEENEGVVIFVHGDGPQNATQDGGYKPLMERFAKQGYASISWDKPGVGDSAGNWLDQSMDDRADEVSEVIEWVKDQENFNTEKIILWGASQAGWVIPKVQQERDDVTASILVGPAINWLRQGEYFTTEEMKRDGKTEDEIKYVLNEDRKESELILSGAAFQTYKQETGDDSLDEDRYTFVQKNIAADATEDIKKIKSPVYVILAENDANVNSAETEKVYRQLLPEWQLAVKTIDNVGHSMLNPSLHDSDMLIYISALLAPKHTLISQDYLDYCEDVIRDI